MNQPSDRLAHATERLAAAVEKQNELMHRLLSGIVLGVGTAVGASLIAGIVILALSRIFQTVGLEELVPKQ